MFRHVLLTTIPTTIIHTHAYSMLIDPEGPMSREEQLHRILTRISFKLQPSTYSRYEVLGSHPASTVLQMQIDRDNKEEVSSGRMAIQTVTS